MAHLVTLLVALSITIGFVDGGETGKCNYRIDPHLVPFPAWPGDNQLTYICQSNCTEILVKNDLLEIIVTPDPSQNFYPIVQYTLIFFGTASYPQPCVVTNSIANPTPLSSLICQNGSPANTIFSSLSAQNYLHLDNNDVQVDINNHGTYFDFQVTLPFDLIKESTGVCVKWNCKEGRERRKRRSNSLIDQIIENYASTAREQALGKINAEFAESTINSVSRDINFSFDQRYAETIISDFLRNSVEQYRNQDTYGNYLRKANLLAAQLICSLGQKTNKLIKSSKPVCNTNTKPARCLQPIDYSQQCN